MPDAMFFMPAVEGMEAPQWFQEYAGSLGTSLDNAFRNIGDWHNDPSQNVSIEVQGSGSLSFEEISDYFAPRQTLRIFAGSWAAAATMRGWAICDGSNGTPKIHPSIDDASPIQRMVRATAYGTDSGGTAGAECHCHTGCGSISCCGCHAHCIDGTICCENAHCHCYTCDTETDGDHQHVNDGCTTCTSHCHGLGSACATYCGYTDLNCHKHAVGSLYTAQSSCCASPCAGVCSPTHCFSCHDHCHTVCGETDCCDASCCGHCHNLCGATCYDDHCHDLACCTCCDGFHKHGNDGVTGVGLAHTHATDDLCTCLWGEHTHTISSHATTCNAHLPQVIDVIWLMKL